MESLESSRRTRRARARQKLCRRNASEKVIQLFSIGRAKHISSNGPKPERGRRFCTDYDVIPESRPRSCRTKSTVTAPKQSSTTKTEGNMRNHSKSLETKVGKRLRGLQYQETDPATSATRNWTGPAGISLMEVKGWRTRAISCERTFMMAKPSH